MVQRGRGSIERIFGSTLSSLDGKLQFDTPSDGEPDQATLVPASMLHTSHVVSSSHVFRRAL